MPTEELTTAQKLDRLIEFYARVSVERNGKGRGVYVGGRGVDTVFTTYGWTAEEAINKAYEEWQNRRTIRAVKDLLR